MAKTLPSLGEQEIQILRLVWQHQPCTERQISDLIQAERFEVVQVLRGSFVNVIRPSPKVYSLVSGESTLLEYNSVSYFGKNLDKLTAKLSPIGTNATR